MSIFYRMAQSYHQSCFFTPARYSLYLARVYSAYAVFYHICNFLMFSMFSNTPCSSCVCFFTHSVCSFCSCHYNMRTNNWHQEIATNNYAELRQMQVLSAPIIHSFPTRAIMQEFRQIHYTRTSIYYL